MKKKIDIAKVRSKREKAFAKGGLAYYSDCEGVWVTDPTGKPALLYASLNLEDMDYDDGKE